MRTHPQITVEFGHLVVAAFEEAARYSRDPEEVEFLATAVLRRMLRRARSKLLIASPAPTTLGPIVAAC